MKTVIVNGSPRRNGNTAQILKQVKLGAEAAGDEVEYVDLCSLNFRGCRSCLAYKLSAIPEHCKCYWQDDLSPVLESVMKADRLIIGSPIYFSEPTADVRAFVERLGFPALSYNDYSSNLQGRVDTVVFFTMNASEEHYCSAYEQRMREYFSALRFLNGTLSLVPVCDTLQVDDYSKYEMKSFSEEHKRKVHEEEFPKDLAKAFAIGKREQAV